MRRDEAIENIYKVAGKEALFVFANGRISREGYLKCDDKRNFYMLASMGKASSIGLGLALNKPEKIIIVFDGDGNILMNLDNLAMIGYFQPENFVHVVLDNEEYATTGGQQSLSEKIKLEKVAQSCGYKKTFKVKARKEILEAIKDCLKSKGPHFILVKVAKEQIGGTKIIPYSPQQIKKRFKQVLI